MSIRRRISVVVMMILTLWTAGMDSTPSMAFLFQDAVGDSDGPDITHMDYMFANDTLDIKLTFRQQLCGNVINQDLLSKLHVDIDQSLLTGFTGGGGLHPRFGVDYEIEIMLLGFCPSGDEATLKYWRHELNNSMLELKRESIPLGNSFYPNGSVFVVGANSTYGTNNNQIFLRVPLNLFSNNSFPICSDIMTFYINQLFPCPLDLLQDLNRAYVNIIATPAYFGSEVDRMPDQGMIHTASVTVQDDYPTGSEDLAAAATDPPDDCLAPPCNNGEEIIGLSAFLHGDNNLTFELKLETYSLEDTAQYKLLFDLDDNAATGSSLTNGSETLGIDLIAQYANFDNPIGEANPLEGTLYFWLDGSFRPLIYIDYLANVWRSNPGYIWITIPSDLMKPYVLSNQSGRIRVIATTSDPPVEDSVDIIPNNGSMQIVLQPIPDIKANGSNGPVNINQQDRLLLNIGLYPGSRSGKTADWWVLANTPFPPPHDWYHYDLRRGSWMPGLVVTYQGSLFDLAYPYEVLDTTGLPTGTYTCYFGVDLSVNGAIDFDQLYHDSVLVNIQ